MNDKKINNEDENTSNDSVEEVPVEELDSQDIKMMETGQIKIYDEVEPDEEDDYVSIRPPSERRKRTFIVLGILLFIGLVLIFFVRSWFLRQIDPPGALGEEVEIVIPKNSTESEIASLLESNAVVPNDTFFTIWATYRSFNDFQAGTYVFRQNMSADQALAVFRDGPGSEEVVTVTIPEGLWVSEIVEILANELPNLSEADFEKALADTKITTSYVPEGVDSWEGLLFPDTYEININSSAEDVIKKLHQRFVEVAGENNYGTLRAQELGVSRYDAIIIASLIEAESRVDADRSKISRVIYNRLNEDVWLDIDATLLYSHKARGGSISSAWLEDGSDPYNTSSRAGEPTRGKLPPTPIGSPGAKSLQAALFPEDGQWMFYTKKDNEGNHYFSVTIDEHNKQVARAKANGVEGY